MAGEDILIRKMMQESGKGGGGMQGGGFVGFVQKYKAFLLVALTVIIIIVIIYYTGKKAGKSESTTTDLPKQTDWGSGNLTDTESKEIQDLAARMYDDMKGFSVTHDATAWYDLAYSTDRIFVGTYNYFNQKYSSSVEDSGTLITWIKDEVDAGAWLSGWLYNTTLSAYRRQILNRAAALNLP